MVFLNRYVLLFSILFLIPLVSAHISDNAHIFVDGFEIDLVTEPQELVAQESVELSISLLEEETGLFVFPTSFDVVIRDNDLVLVNESIQLESEKATFSVQFPKAGEYALHGIFFDENETKLVEFESELIVLRGNKARSPATLTRYTELLGTAPFIIEIIIIVLVIIGILLLDRKEKSRKKRR